MQNFWPESIDVKDNEPILMMREQAKLLGHRTRNVVKADVSTESSYNGNFISNFYIVAPTLNNYHFLLFTVENSIDMYPLTIYIDEVLAKELGVESKKTRPPSNYMDELLQTAMNTTLTGTRKKEAIRHSLILPSEDAFINNLRKIIGSQRTKQVISSLLSMANGSYEQPQS